MKGEYLITIHGTMEQDGEKRQREADAGQLCQRNREALLHQLKNRGHRLCRLCDHRKGGGFIHLR